MENLKTPTFVNVLNDSREAFHFFERDDIDFLCTRQWRLLHESKCLDQTLFAVVMYLRGISVSCHFTVPKVLRVRKVHRNNLQMQMKVRLR